MILDGKDAHDLTHDLHADISIIGAGAVGCYLASLAVSLGKSTLLIEAGGLVPQMRPDGGGARSVLQQHAGTSLGRAFGLGGTSAYWGGQLDELRSVDLQRPDRTWPITHEELLRYYQKCYDRLGLPKTHTRKEYLDFMGVRDIDHPEIEQYSTFWLEQPNFARLYLDKLKDSPKLTVIMNATVSGIEFEPDQRTAKWVDAFTDKGSRIRARGRSFIFCAGTIANAQFFLTTKMNSETPWKNNDRIGRQFHDHISFRTASVEIADKKAFHHHFENGFSGGRKIQPKLRNREPALESAPVSMCGMFDFKSSLKDSLGNVKRTAKAIRAGVIDSSILSLPRDVYRVGSSMLPIVTRLLARRRIKALSDMGVDLVVQSEQIPSSNSLITLRDDERLPNGLMPIDVRWSVKGSELASIKRFTIQIDSFLKAAGLGSLKIKREILEEDPSLISSVDDTYHMAGGLVASENAREGVTNSYGLVWGSSNVYVGGASIFPSSGYANTTLTALAMAHRMLESITAYDRETK